jgi:hypothetical protein
MTALTEWQSFYEIVGSSAGALIGLQFVVLALVSNIPRTPELVKAGKAFITPTIVHFSTVLLLAAAICAPWHCYLPLAAIWGAIGLAGVIYSLLVLRRMKRQAAYEPEFVDWLYYAALPLLAYAVLISAAILIPQQPSMSLFLVAGATLLLLLTGIHNAWDNVVYHVFTNNQP